jgi:uncharacterized protein (DUF2141 family)
MSRAAVVLFVGAVALAAVEARQGVPVPPAGSPQQAPAAPAPPATGIIAGKVIDGGTGAPIGEVSLTLSGAALAPPAGAGRGGPVPPGAAGQSSRRVITDGQGRFLLRDLPAGSFSLTASAGGYLSSSAGVMRPNGQGQPVVLPADGRVLDLVIRMFKYGAVSGTVTDEAGEPVVGASIRPFRSEFVGGRRRFTAPGTVVTTDDRGVYRIPQLIPGDYVIGFVASSISMPAEALVETERARTAGSAASTAFSNDAQASGANIFTQPSIAVGEWRLLYGTNARAPAPSEDGQVVMSYTTTFHSDSTLVTNATIVTVGSGEDKSGIDFQIRPARTAKVSGILTGPDGPVKFFGLRLLRADVDQFASDTTMDPIMSTTTSAGEFTFLSVPPGAYVLKAVKVPDANGPMMSFVINSDSGPINAMRPDMSVPSTKPSLWASLPVQVAGADIRDLVVMLKTGARLTGHVEFDGVTPPPAENLLKQISVSVDPPGSAFGFSNFSFFQSWRGQLTDAGTFTSVQLPPGRYFIRNLNPPQGWMLDSITANGVDVSDVAMDIGSSDINDVVIRFTDRRTQLSGVVRNGARQPDATASVMAFPADRALWTDYSSSPRRLRVSRSTSTGSFTMPTLPPGDYLVVAISDTDGGSFPDPKFLEKISSLATRVTIDRGQTKTQDLVTVSVR